MSALAIFAFATLLAAACGSSVARDDLRDAGTSAVAGAASAAGGEDGSGGRGHGDAGGELGGEAGTKAGRGGRAGRLPPGAGGEGAAASGSSGASAGEGADPDACGDGALTEHAGEFECDDGNAGDGDGCSAECRVEAGWTCSGEPSRCSADLHCGSGVLRLDEECDDGNVAGGDGCSSLCSREPGWVCPAPGLPCRPDCGDSQRVGPEECDDGNRASADGCSIVCRVEPGFVCEGARCTQSACGNAVREAGEACDEGASNGLVFGDGSGCSEYCTREPSCRWNGTTSACSTACGDANRDPGEECDDGNAAGGDGCSEACRREPGFACEDLERPELGACSDRSGSCLRLPIVFRDFEGQNSAEGHRDFFFLGKPGIGGEITRCVPNASGGAPSTLAPGSACLPSDASGPCLGIAAERLDLHGKPALENDRCRCIFTDRERTGILEGEASCSLANGETRNYLDTSVRIVESAQSFGEWFLPSHASAETRAVLELEGSAGAYRFASSAPGLLTGATGRTVQDDIHANCLGRSTRLASGFFPLDTAEGLGSTRLCNLWPYWAIGLSAENCMAGAVYPVVAEWDPLAGPGATDGDPAGCPMTGSGGFVPSADGTGQPLVGVPHNYYFTSEVRRLFRYDEPFSMSLRTSGDGWVFVNGRLAIDLGGTHETRLATASVDARFGLESGGVYELVIFHANRHPRESVYELTLPAFARSTSRCLPRCGDGVATAGEECDLGASNGSGRYGGCSDDCKFGPHCGDGLVNGNEHCDFGAGNGRGDCDAACRSVD